MIQSLYRVLFVMFYRFRLPKSTKYVSFSFFRFLFYPLRSIVAQGNHTLGVVKSLVDINPIVLSIADRVGNVPLHNIIDALATERTVDMNIAEMQSSFARCDVQQMSLLSAETDPVLCQVVICSITVFDNEIKMKLVISKMSFSTFTLIHELETKLGVPETAICEANKPISNRYLEMFSSSACT